VQNLYWPVRVALDSVALKVEPTRESEEAMSRYGQYCPVAKAAEVFAVRWVPLILRELLSGSTRFNDLHRGVPLMSRSLLSHRLRQLAEIGVVARKPGASTGEYHLTEAGRDFAPIVELLGNWGQRWYRTKYAGDELDAGLLMWDMHRGVRTSALPRGRTTVQFIFSEQPAGQRQWWLVSDAGEVDLCPNDPGFEIDLYVRTDLRTMTRVWMGDLPVSTAIHSGAIDLTGQRDLRRRFEQWFGLSHFADVEEAQIVCAPARTARRAAAERVDHVSS
jgi:DNA-binding HxlR family transcriptional regulator